MKSFLLKIFLSSLLFILLTGAGLVYWVTEWSRQPVPLQKSPLMVVIKPNSSVASVARQLEQGGVQISSWGFELLARLQQQQHLLQAGSYTLETGATPRSILDKMVRGEVTMDVVTLIEGWEFRRMRATLDAHPGLRHETSGMPDAALLKAIGAKESHPEGLFFPDTYLFAPGSSDLDLYRRAYRLMQKRLTDSWKGRSTDLPFKTPYEALILASIVEKETGQEAERPLIAAVFLNRLRQRMLLQTDPTVIYGLGVTFDGNLRKRDLMTDSPYNTYTRAGLPPTPIALPGKASLAAVFHPAPSTALYFVARGDGSSAFSNNLGEHNRAVNQYQRGK